MRHAFLALTNPAPGRERAFNAWYDEAHLPEVVRYGAGMRGGRRFRLAAAQRPGQVAPPWKYLAWYDLEHDDLATYWLAPWTTSPERPPLQAFAGLVADGFAGWVFTPIGNGTTGFASGCPRSERFLFMALTNAEPGQEAAFNAWYNERHLPEILASLPGFVAGRRYRAAPEQRPGQPPPPWEYLAVYEVAADSAAAVHVAAGGVRALTRAPADTLARDHVAWVFQPMGPYRPMTETPASA